jgi:histidine triad (HIT) family protein
MTDCIFCKIIEGGLPAERVYEDDLVVAFQDANPVAPVHILIVPRNHVPTLNDLPEDDQILSYMGRVARKIAQQYGVADSGYHFFINVNREGGQVVFHLHAHLVAGGRLSEYLVGLAIATSILWRKLVKWIGSGRG